MNRERRFAESLTIKVSSDFKRSLDDLADRHDLAASAVARDCLDAGLAVMRDRLRKRDARRRD